MVPFQILLSHLDVVKDVVLVIRLLQSIGWYLDLTQFSSVVIFLGVECEYNWEKQLGMNICKTNFFVGHISFALNDPCATAIGYY